MKNENTKWKVISGNSVISICAPDDQSIIEKDIIVLELRGNYGR